MGLIAGIVITAIIVMGAVTVVRIITDAVSRDATEKRDAEKEVRDARRS